MKNNSDIPSIKKIVKKSGLYRKSTFGDATTNNLLFHTDNFVILKDLLPLFKNKVKLCYIDPPYNTKQSFEHYDDNYSIEAWKAMMKARINLIHDWLNETGSIWISIDDKMVHHLRIICDEIFLPSNFIGTIIWQKNTSSNNDTKRFSNCHDYIVVYAKNISKWSSNLLPRNDKANARYTNPDNDIRGVWTPSDLTVKTPSEDYIYPITTPTGRQVWPAASRSWSMSEKSFKKLVKEKRIWFGKDGNNVPRLKRFLSDVQQGMVPKTLWFKDEVGDNFEAKREVKKINPTEVFTTPKPEKLIEKIISIATNQGDLVVDLFAGSGTTGAVAMKMGRKWVMTEVNGVCESHCIPRLLNVVKNNKSVGFHFFDRNTN